MFLAYLCIPKIHIRIRNIIIVKNIFINVTFYLDKYNVLEKASWLTNKLDFAYKV